jgi:putative ABC transport system permease protein
VQRDILMSFAMLGLGLAALGIYGVIARTMRQRSGEFAVRLALGASVRDITRMVLSSGVKLALIGSAIGLLGAVAVARLLGSGYPGMQFESAPVIVGTTAFLISVALIACYLPARSASSISAAEALR